MKTVTIIHAVGDKVSVFDNEVELIDFANLIRYENEDFDMEIGDKEQALEYLRTYCGNLEVIAQ